MVLQIVARQTCTFCLFFYFPSFCIIDHILNNTGHYLLFQLLMLYSISFALPRGFALVSCVHCTEICFIMIHKRQCIFNTHYQACCTFHPPPAAAATLWTVFSLPFNCKHGHGVSAALCSAPPTDRTKCVFACNICFSFRRF